MVAPVSHIDIVRLPCRRRPFVGCSGLPPSLQALSRPAGHPGTKRRGPGILSSPGQDAALYSHCLGALSWRVLQRRADRSKATPPDRIVVRRLFVAKPNTSRLTWPCSSSRWISAVADTRTAPTRATSRSATSTRSSQERRHAGPLSPSSVRQIPRRFLSMRALLRGCAHHV